MQVTPPPSLSARQAYLLRNWVEPFAQGDWVDVATSLRGAVLQARRSPEGVVVRATWGGQEVCLLPDGQAQGSGRWSWMEGAARAYLVVRFGDQDHRFPIPFRRQRPAEPHVEPHEG